MNGPRVGKESDEYRAVCVYAPGPGSPHCGAPATVHVLTDSPGYGVVTLASCGDHARSARSAGAFIAEHVYEGWCGFPGTLWGPDNRCVLDDSGEGAPARCAAVAQLVGAGR